MRRRRTHPVAATRALVLLACGLAGCDAAGCEDGRGSEPHATTAALIRCETALRGIEREAPSRSAALARLWGECADVQREPACRDAWREAARTPFAHPAAKLAQTCGPAYCPALPEPRPKLCSGAPTPSGAALDAQWAELQRAIWLHELGADAGWLEAALVRAFHEAGERWPVREPGGEAR
jgi:hypothetical protein